MTEKEMDKFSDLLAEKVFKLIMDRQAELDQQFIEQVKASGQDIEIALQQETLPKWNTNATEEEVLLAELARLMTLLQAYEDKEQYEKAAIIKNKIEKLEYKLNKL